MGMGNTGFPLFIWASYVPVLFLWLPSARYYVNKLELCDQREIQMPICTVAGLCLVQCVLSQELNETDSIPTLTVNSGAHRVHGKHPMAWHYHAKQKVQKKPILGTFSREESEPWWSLIDVASLFAFSVLILIFINFNFSKQKLLTYNAMHSHTFFNLCFLCPFAQVMNHHRFYQQ